MPFRNKGLRELSESNMPTFPESEIIKLLQQLTKKRNLKTNREIINIFKKLERKQITLFAHLLRAPRDNKMTKVSVQPNGKRIWAGFRRVGRPKLKWYEVVRSATIDKFIILNILQANWENEMSETEMLQMIIDTAHDRESTII